MSSGFQHAAFPMEDASRVGEARRHAVQLAHECGFDDVEAGRVAIVVTELANNLVRHARQGCLWIAGRTRPCGVEVVAVDRGPGIVDVARALGDGYSTGGTPGTGLGAVRRLSQEFDMHSVPGQGTVTVARLRPATARPTFGDPSHDLSHEPSREPSLRVAALALTAPGETLCGDGWAFATDGERVSAIVADGLGHGPDAHEAASKALETFGRDPFAAPRRLITDIHAALRSTRGAAVTVAQADASQQSVRSSGVGNVVARLVSGTTDRTLLGQHGTAGVTIRTPDETVTPWPQHALLVMCSDGIESRWKAEGLMPVLGHDPSIVAALLARDHCRGRDDATVLVLRRNA